MAVEMTANLAAQLEVFLKSPRMRAGDAEC
jgi:hypothetical protein